jgi:hypothetical protein
MPLIVESITVPYSEVERVAALERDAQALIGITEAHDAANQALGAANAALEAERQALAKAVIVNRELSAQLQKASLTRKPTITRDMLRNVAGVTVENSKVSPSEAQYDRVRLNLMLIAGMGLNTARWFMGKGEVKNHEALSETSPSHLPAFAHSVGITYGADTVDRVVWDTLKIEDDPLIDARVKAVATAELQAYLRGLAKWAAFFVFNDANQYRGALFPAKTLERMVERVRSITPNMPLIASLTANALPGDYAMFDHLEAQTFGTAAEFKIFMGRKFDVFCIDGRTSASKTYLQSIAPVFLATNPHAFFLYPTLVTDWLSMPGQMSVIREMVAKWWTLPR